MVKRSPMAYGRAGMRAVQYEASASPVRGGALLAHHALHRRSRTRHLRGDAQARSRRTFIAVSSQAIPPLSPRDVDNAALEASDFTPSAIAKGADYQRQGRASIFFLAGEGRWLGLRGARAAAGWRPIGSRSRFPLRRPGLTSPAAAPCGGVQLQARCGCRHAMAPRRCRKSRRAAFSRRPARHRLECPTKVCSAFQGRSPNGSPISATTSGVRMNRRSMSASASFIYSCLGRAAGSASISCRVISMGTASPKGRRAPM